MSSSMALRRSPKPGALTAQTLSVPRSLLTTSVARASPSMSSAMMSSGLPGSATLLEERDEVAGGADLLLVDEDVGVFEHGLHRGGVGDEVRARGSPCRTACLRQLDVGVEALAFFDGDDAVLADLVHRLGDHLADLLVLVGASRCRPGRFPSTTRPSCVICFELVDDRLDGRRRCRAGSAWRWRRRRRSSGLRRRWPRRRRWRWWCRRRRRWWSCEATSFTICAPMFS